MAIRTNGACQGIDPTLFDDHDDFPRSDGGRAAKAICQGCPVLSECRDYAMGNERWGIWGGLDRRERDLARAGAPVHDPEERRHAAQLRQLLADGVPLQNIAEQNRVSVRTVLRWAGPSADRAAA
jgi:WhiB family redox-sensing transcriptional regulator